MKRFPTPTMTCFEVIVALGVLLVPAADARADEPRPTQSAPAAAANSPLADIIDPAEKAVIIATGHRFTEGPAWVPARSHGNERGYLLYTDIPKNRVYRLDFDWESAATDNPPKPEVWLEPSGHANGLLVDPEAGVYLACHDGSVQWSKFEDPETTATLANSYDGKSLNSPNDLAKLPDGSIVFTDPPFGLRPPLGAAGRTRELDFCGVYRLPKSGPLELLTDKIKSPNGIAVSPDGKTLYIADTRSGQIYAMDDAAADREAGAPAFENLREFCKVDAVDKVSFADGLKVDVLGNLYVAGPKGAWVFDKFGKHLGVIEAPEGKSPTNLGFGGDDGMTLFMTTRDSVSAVRVGHAGAGVRPRVEPASKNPG